MDHIQDFVDHLRLLQRSERTIERYKMDIGLWLRACPDDWNSTQFLKFLSAYTNPRTRISKFTAVRQYVRFLARRGLVDDKWLAEVQIRQVQKEDYIMLRPEEIRTLLNCENSPIPWVRHRNRCLMYLYFTTACRNSEIRMLKKSDVDLIGQQIRVKIKGGRVVASHLTPQAVDELREWMPRARGEWVFPQYKNRNKPMAAHRISQLVRECAVRAGLKKRVSPHCLRRAAATTIYRKTKDILMVKDLLHHRTLEMATVYARLASDDVANAQDDALSI